LILHQVTSNRLVKMF